MQKQNSQNNRVGFVSDNKFMSNLRNNIKNSSLTIQELSEKANLPYETVKNIIYSNTKDCKLSTAIKLAKAIGISIDELAGADTIPEHTLNAICLARNFPAHFKVFVNRIIKDLSNALQDEKRVDEFIPVMIARENNEGNICTTHNYKYYNIKDIDVHLRSKIFMGFKIVSNNQEPYFFENDLIFIANDRLPKPNEMCVCSTRGILRIYSMRIENNEKHFYSIRDNKFRKKECHIDELIGYICHYKRQEIFDK